MTKILINDGMHTAGIDKLKDHGFEVMVEKIAQESLPEVLPDYDAICVRSATKVRKDLIDKCPGLKVIARGGVGLDNIDVEYATERGIKVINTPAASSRSVAELAFAHIFSIARFLYKSNKHMPETGAEEFKALKKSFSKGFELKGRTIGIVGMGRIGEECARIAYGLEMNVIGVDPFIESKQLQLNIAGRTHDIIVDMQPLDSMLSKADIISLHIPYPGKALLSDAEFKKMKKGVIVINAARGGVIDEDALLTALHNHTVAAAGLDVFENEPTPRQDLLQHPHISFTPHIGASTVEAQEKIALELADQLIEIFKGA